MDRQDGKDPFDYHTYYAENGLTIATMIEFRAFCAGFFECHVRSSTPTNEASMAKFIKLITRAEVLFARARAVIPELQVPQDQSSHENANIRRVLLATQQLRGSNTKPWGNQPDELAWLKLANDGQALVDKEGKEGKGHVKQASNAGGQASPSKLLSNRPSPSNFTNSSCAQVSQLEMDTRSKPATTVFQPHRVCPHLAG